MMDTRLLELLKNPELLISGDLEKIEREIKKTPYMQSFRALHLLGTHRFHPENYHRELSETAAYTTDKKILYQFINGKQQEPTEVETVVAAPIPEENKITAPVSEETLIDKTDEISEPEPLNSESLIAEKTLPSTDTQKEETILKTADPQEKEPEINPVEETKLQEKSKQENFQEESHKQESVESEQVIQEFEPEEVINEEKIQNEKEEIQDPSQLSFHGLQEFLPEVKISAKEEPLNFVPAKPSKNRHEEEMKKLIAEVEAKMKKKKPQPVSEEPQEEHSHNTEINFAEMQPFDESGGQEVTPVKINVQDKPVENGEQNEEQQEVNMQENLGWKPMNFEGSVPDSLLSKTSESPSLNEPVRKQTENQEKAPSEHTEEIPVMNVSFFSPTISNIQENEKPEEKQLSAESNVPNFINTWQIWLKIDRNDSPKPKEIQEKVEVREKAIEKFIENEPKISQLKEESNFVVKEKKGDINHLMTETLAKLYSEQKLYSKAIKAYETLIQKHPEKADYFADKIQEVKEMRSNPQ